MSPFHYDVMCYEPGCTRRAEYKIAARWSDGLTSELKTYGLTCEAHLPACFRRAVGKQAVCPLVSGESLETPGIYRLISLRIDKELDRLTGLEQQFQADSTPSS